MPVKAANPRTQDQDATKGQHPGVTREDWQDGTPATLSIGPQWSPAMKTGKTSTQGDDGHTASGRRNGARP